MIHPVWAQFRAGKGAFEMSGDPWKLRGVYKLSTSLFTSLHIDKGTVTVRATSLHLKCISCIPSSIIMTCEHRVGLYRYMLLIIISLKALDLIYVYS